MIERKIRLTDTEEVKDFVRAAGKCDFDIDVCYNRAVIDAKSLLGMLYLGICKDLVVKYGEQDECFEHIMNKYTFAHIVLFLCRNTSLMSEINNSGSYNGQYE